jgi:hypothetical protein
MRKLIVFVGLLALVPGLSPAKADALTLSERVARLEAKLSCLRKIPMVEYTGFTWYGDPAGGESAQNTYDTQSRTDTPTNDNPDGLTDLGSVPGVDFAFETAGPDYYVLAVRAKRLTGRNDSAVPGLRQEVRAAADAALVALSRAHDASAPARTGGIRPLTRKRPAERASSSHWSCRPTDSPASRPRRGC